MKTFIFFWHPTFENPAYATVEKHINRVVGTRYANLRNSGRIASKLTKVLKVQLVRSLMLFHIGYCNALFRNIPEYLLHKLTKVLYAAVRFIFGLRGSAFRMHIPYLKSLHFLPIEFRIEFKIAFVAGQMERAPIAVNWLGSTTFEQKRSCR